MGALADMAAATAVRKKLPRDGDGDGIIYEGTPMERPLRPGDRILHEGRERIVQGITGPRLRLKDPATGETKRVRVGSPKLDPHPGGSAAARRPVPRSPRRVQPQDPRHRARMLANRYGEQVPTEEVFHHPPLPNGSGRPRGAWKHETGTAKLKDVVPTQPVVRGSALERMAETGGPADVTQPVRASRAEDGRVILLDGHHRVASAIMRGDEEIENVDFVSSEPRPQPDAPNAAAANAPQSTPRVHRSQLPNPALEPDEEWKLKVAEGQERALKRIFDPDSVEIDDAAVRRVANYGEDEDEVRARIRESIRAWGAHLREENPDMTAEEWKQAETEYVKRITDPSRARIVSRVTMGGLKGILNAGRFKTQHENRRSNGYLNPDTRAGLEKQLWNIPEDSDPMQRPVYGYLTDEDEPVHRDGGFLMQYGDVVVVMKNDVRERTTIVSDDSLDIKGSPASLAMPIDEADWRIGRLNEGFGHPMPVSRSGEKLSDHPGYVEAQVHGGVHLEDIDRVIFGVEPPDQLKRLLDRKGVRYEVRDEGRRRATMQWITQERYAQNDIERSEKKIEQLEQGKIDAYDESPYPSGKWVRGTDNPRMYKWFREGRTVDGRYVPGEYVDVPRDEYLRLSIEKLKRSIEAAKKRRDEAKEKRLEYERLYDEGELDGFVDVKSMSTKKLRAWYIELAMRKYMTDEPVDHLYREASDEGSSRGRKGSEGMGIVVAADSPRGETVWGLEVRAVAEKLRERGIRLKQLEPGKNGWHSIGKYLR